MTMKERRKAKGMTQAELAAAADVDQGSISHYEKGHWKPRYLVAKRIAEVLGCTVGELMRGFEETG